MTSISLLAKNISQKYPHLLTIQYPVKREYFKSNYIVNAKSFSNLFSVNQKVGLYIHIPFCKSKCVYCNFSVDTRDNDKLKNLYMNTLNNELTTFMKFKEKYNLEIAGIDIGGGTPTSVTTESLVNLLQTISPLIKSTDKRFISIETTPHIASTEIDKLISLKKNGISRISMGVQSYSSKILGNMNRDSQINLTEKAFINLKDVGFERISADIIFCLPGQTFETWKSDLQRIVDIEPHTITTYDCIYKGKGRAITKKSSNIPNQKQFGQYYDYAYNYLHSKGYYAHYGSVNFSKYENETGVSNYFESRLLDGISYAGIGNYASSLFGNHWWFAPYSVDSWLDEIVNKNNSLPIGNCYELPIEEIATKYILASLSFGIIDPVRFKNAIGINLYDIYNNAITVAIKENIIEERNNKFYIKYGNFKNMALLRALFYPTKALNWISNNIC